MEIRTALEEGMLQLSGCVPSQMEHLLWCLGGGFGCKVVVTYDEQKALEILNNYTAFDRAAVYYPARDPLFDKADIRGSYLSEQRLEVVKRLFSGEQLTVITTLDAFSEEFQSFEEIRREMITIGTGQTLNVEELAARLVSFGYENESQVSGHGEFSIRGNIIDIFPYTESAPFRIDLWGDEVETIKVFDVESQRSIEVVPEFSVFPGETPSARAGEPSPSGPAGLSSPEAAGILPPGNREAGKTDTAPSGFFQYFDNHTLFVFDEPAKIFEETVVSDELLAQFCKQTCLLFTMLDMSCEELPVKRRIFVNARNIPSYNGRFDDLVKDLEKYKKENWDVTLCTASRLRADRLIKELQEKGASPKVEVCAVRTGFEYPDLKFSVISEVDIFGVRRAARRRRRRFSGDPIKDFTDLNVGDYVVHEQHGVGIYRGIERIEAGGTEKDYMKIDYAGNASLYVLATQFDKIQKYSGSDGAKPKIHRLGGREWNNTKSRVRSSVQDIAAELVALYASRQNSSGYKYMEDTVWQQEFEEQFEFEETEDQLRAVSAVKADMESSKIMDRLICGDVGFGKTEVALRAAFKAVQEGKQVAFLVPTTILAQQHYNTITERMKNYPVTVAQLSRFSTGAAQKKTVAEIQRGLVDIVVGTHRLLSKDIVFKDLGLLVVDEEQRFGVSHKEKIKQLRKNVDVLTLSATPIPRTLHMSLSGIRDMSLLTEPPVDRVPIQTYVMEYSDDAVREAILREARRGGQVYYVYNRTSNIDMVAAKLQEMVPQLRVQYAHGKMAARQLEQIMEDFIAGDIDILVSTTIIETGMDISNVNTIIVHDADRFGLSQLYQLRGRVGRSNRTAYAFLLYRKDRLLREVAEKRLKAIREFSDLGSGIRIAMRDLEIRGAGNVLGAEQSGHMEAVGYELYCKMLNEAVSMLKGERILADFDTTVDLKIDGFIPATYIKNEYEKLNMYKKISAITTPEELEDIENELTDRFGPVPEVTENLLKVALLKARAHAAYVTEISGGRSEFKICMFKNAPIDTYKLLGFLKEYNEGRGGLPGGVAVKGVPSRGGAGIAGKSEPSGGSRLAGKGALTGTAVKGVPSRGGAGTAVKGGLQNGRAGQGSVQKNGQLLRFVADSSPYFVLRPEPVPRSFDEAQEVLFQFFDGLEGLILTAPADEAPAVPPSGSENLPESGQQNFV